MARRDREGRGYPRPGVDCCEVPLRQSQIKLVGDGRIWKGLMEVEEFLEPAAL